MNREKQWRDSEKQKEYEEEMTGIGVKRKRTFLVPGLTSVRISKDFQHQQNRHFHTLNGIHDTCLK